MAEIVNVTLPKTVEDVAESLVVFWFKSVGDFIEQGEALVEVQTEKATFEVEAPATGRIGKILVKRGDVAMVGDTLATIEQAEVALPVEQQMAVANAVEQQVAAASTVDQKSETAEQAPAPSGQISPLARRLAKELRVDLAQVNGTGPGGRITEQDVRKAANQSKATSADEDTVELSAIRRTIAMRMMQSMQQTAQLTETAWADVTALAENRKQLAPGSSWNDWILRAVVAALQSHPNINATWVENGIKHWRHIHLGVAVDTEDGLLVPSIKNAEQKSLSELSASVRAVVEKARTRKLSASELSGTTFTVTNLGAYGIQFFTPIINPPEAAILGVGQIEPQLVLENGELVQRMRLPLSFTFDHRMIDGAPAAKFVQTIIHLLAEPEKLL